MDFFKRFMCVCKCESDDENKGKKEKLNVYCCTSPAAMSDENDGCPSEEGYGEDHNDENERERVRVSNDVTDLSCGRQVP